MSMNMLGLNFKGKCDRCGRKIHTFTMSMFNYDYICEDCKEKERNHPMYEEACLAERSALANGNRDFAGIGKPKDL